MSFVDILEQYKKKKLKTFIEVVLIWKLILGRMLDFSTRNDK